MSMRLIICYQKKEDDFMYFFGDGIFEITFMKNSFQCIFIIYLLSEIFLFLITTLMSKNDSTKSDKGSMFILILGTIMCICLDGFFKEINLFDLPLFLFYFGAPIMIFGIILRIVSVFTLKRSFTFSVQTNKNQKIIKDGPYKIIRHPAYTGSILTQIGMAICFRTIPGIISVLVILFFIYHNRIMLEERVLKEVFKTDYYDYQKRTWRIFPFIW